MKSFPRIYSISTVGLIFHYNSDYLLHPVRTDFNGESGSGKSLVADLLQLIFVGKRGNKYYKPGTDSSSPTGRGTESLPLDSIGYAFINIQKAEKQFLTIGIYIQRNTGSITPFIVQKGILWEKNSLFDYADKILLHDNFLTKEKTIAEIENLRKKILKPKGFILETFQPGDISRYHNLLYYNEILPIDLSQDDDKLITYAQIIQSFARAKAIKLDTKEFKNFLFADDEEIYEEYKNQIKTLQDYQRQYLDQRKTITKVSSRFSVLKIYTEAVATRDKNFLDYLTLKAAFDYHRSYDAEQEYNKSKKNYGLNLLIIHHYSLHIHQFEQNQIAKQIGDTIKTIEQTEAELRITNQNSDQANQDLAATVLIVGQLQGDLFTLRQIDEGIEQLDALIRKYTTLERIEFEIKNQPLFKINKEKLQSFLQALLTLNINDQFKNSYYTELSFQLSLEKNIKGIEKLNQEIEECNRLIDAYTSKDKSSIIAWVLGQSGKSFTTTEESVLRHFILLSTEKPSSESKERRYIPSPEKLLASLKIIKEDEESFWLNLDGVMEEIRYVIDPSFSGPREIDVESILSSLEEEVLAKASKRDQLTALKDGLEKANWSFEIYDLFKNKEAILSFEEDPTLPTLAQFEKIGGWYRKRSQYKEELEQTIEKWELIRTKEGDLRTTISESNGKKIELGLKLNDLNKALQGLNQKLREKEIAISVQKERIEGIRIEYFNTIDASEIQGIDLQTAQSIKSYIKSNSLDGNKVHEERIGPLYTQNGTLLQQIRIYEDPDHVQGLAQLSERYKLSKRKYYRERGAEFNPEEHQEKYSEEIVKNAEESYDDSEKRVNELHEHQVRQLLPDNETLRLSKDIETIARELLPKVFEGKQIVSLADNLESEVTGYLTSINESMRQIDDHKLKLIQGIFNKVSSVYDEYDDKVKDIRQFFEEKQITGGMKVKIDFYPSKHYPIEWISSLKRQINNQAIQLAPLFKDSDEELSAEELIIRTFKQHSNSKVEDPDIRKLTNPKSYFDVEVNLVRPSGEKSEGSSGQQYAKIALLCIARLSRIERDKRLRRGKTIPGIRFMPIDEVAGLGGNFDLLYQIANEYDYQILTMTISPDLDFVEGQQYVYILNGDEETNEKKINMPPFGLFTQEDLQENIGPFIKAQTDEKRINMADNC